MVPRFFESVARGETMARVRRVGVERAAVQHQHLLHPFLKNGVLHLRVRQRRVAVPFSKLGHDVVRQRVVDVPRAQARHLVQMDAEQGVGRIPFRHGAGRRRRKERRVRPNHPVRLAAVHRAGRRGAVRSDHVGDGQAARVGASVKVQDVAQEERFFFGFQPQHISFHFEFF